MNKENQIFISISQIAILIGESPFGSLSDIIYTLWVKADNNNYQKKKLELETKYNKSFENLSEWNKLELLSKELGLDTLSKKTEKAMKNDNHKSLLDEQSAIIRDIDQVERKDIEDLEQKKNTLSKLVNSFSNRGFGNNHESSAIDVYCKLTNSKIIDKQKIVIGRIKKIKNTEWFIKGKIDGVSTDVSGNLSLIEIKNRTKSLFGYLKDYEKPQIQTYMKLLNLNKGYMVEYLKQTQNKLNKNENNINIIEVQFDESYWDFIKKRLLQFIKFFYHFLENDDLQKLILFNNININDENEKIIRDLLHLYFI
jgi:hypothetical protein